MGMTDDSLTFFKLYTMRTLLTFLLMAIAGSPVFSQNKDEQALSAAVESLRKAMIDPDKATLDRIVTDELTYGHSNGMIQDKTAFEEALLNKSSDFVTVDLSQQTMHISGSMAWVRHTLSATTNDGGKPGTTHLYVLTVWTKQKGEWKLFARQAVKVPA